MLINDVIEGVKTRKVNILTIKSTALGWMIKVHMAQTLSEIWLTSHSREPLTFSSLALAQWVAKRTKCTNIRIDHAMIYPRLSSSMTHCPCMTESEAG